MSSGVPLETIDASAQVHKIFSQILLFFFSALIFYVCFASSKQSIEGTFFSFWFVFLVGSTASPPECKMTILNGNTLPASHEVALATCCYGSEKKERQQLLLLHHM